MKLVVLCVAALFSVSTHAAVLDSIKFTANDSVLVIEGKDTPLFAWQDTKPLVPGSLAKLATAHMAIEKWGLSHRFVTDFLIAEDTLWVKGYGDPFLVSEELDKLVPKLKHHLTLSGAPPIKYLHIDNSYFDLVSVPGRSNAVDPYNAPVSAVSANFNTAMLSNKGGQIVSAEPQTPLTTTAKKFAHTLKKNTDRVNLVNADNAQSHFAELLLIKLGWTNVEIKINQKLPENADLVYQHRNSHDLEHVLRGTLEFSNNFIANQLFLKLGEVDDDMSVSIDGAQKYSNTKLSEKFAWKGHKVDEGSGLSKKNRMSARQIDQLLVALEPHKHLLKKIKVNSKSALVYAKTGTLNGVRSYAGFISFPAESANNPSRNYRFIFNFNRAVAYRYRDQVLEQLLDDLEKR